MNEPVVLKSNKYGLTLYLDPVISFENLVRAICTKFAESRTFFGQTEMILETTGRDLSNVEALVIIEAIELNSDIKITLLNENNEIKDARMKGMIDRFYTDEIFDNAKIIRNSITKEDDIYSDSSVIILGDVKSKASITAKGNIIVLGSLIGAAYAGYPDNSGAYIVCGDLESDNITIGHISGEVKKETKWATRIRKSNEEPIGITVWNKELISEPISSGLLKKLK